MRGTKPSAYTDSKTVNYERHIERCVRQALGALPPFAGAVAMAIAIHVGVPASASKRRQRDMLAHIEMPTKTPDTDNVVKAILDGCNRVAFLDDKQVVNLTAEKRYSENPRCEVQIMEMAA
jgi:Holliday junction resolvase RusA-like endonuclease